MEQFFQIMIDAITMWGYTAIIIGMFMESACMPVPSELIFGFVGYLVYLGRMDFTIAVIAGVLGGLLGSIAAYLAGYYGGQPFVAKYGKYIFLSRRHVATAQKWFDRYGIKAVFYSRMLPVIRTFISLPAGFTRVPFAQFVLYTVLGSIPWTIGLIYGGMLLGENWHKLNDIGHKASLAVAIALVVIIVYYVKRNRTETS